MHSYAQAISKLFTTWNIDLWAKLISVSSVKFVILFCLMTIAGMKYEGLIFILAMVEIAVQHSKLVRIWLQRYSLCSLYYVRFKSKKLSQKIHICTIPIRINMNKRLFWRYSNEFYILLIQIHHIDKDIALNLAINLTMCSTSVGIDEKIGSLSFSIPIIGITTYIHS